MSHLSLTVKSTERRDRHPDAIIERTPYRCLWQGDALIVECDRHRMHEIMVHDGQRLRLDDRLRLGLGQVVGIGPAGILDILHQRRCERCDWCWMVHHDDLVLRHDRRRS